MPNKVIALTGGIGSGKSTALHIFKELGATIISTDNITHQLLNEKVNMLAICNQFNIKTDDNNTLNKKELRQICFNNPQQKLWLENLLHPQIFDIIEKKLTTHVNHYFIIEIPLLFDINIPFTIDYSCLVYCEKHQQIQRLLTKNKLSQQEILTIINQQTTNQEKLKLVDDIIFNTKDTTHLTKQVKILHKKYTKTI